LQSTCFQRQEEQQQQVVMATLQMMASCACALQLFHSMAGDFAGNCSVSCIE
jgi:glucokinase